MKFHRNYWILAKKHLHREVFRLARARNAGQHAWDKRERQVGKQGNAVVGLL